MQIHNNQVELLKKLEEDRTTVHMLDKRVSENDAHFQLIYKVLFGGVLTTLITLFTFFKDAFKPPH